MVGRVFLLVAVFALLDVVTGVAKAYSQHDVRSSAMRSGLWHKLGEFLAVSLAVALEKASLFLELGVDVPAVPAVGAYIVIMETLSILENISVLSPDLRVSDLFRIGSRVRDDKEESVS